MSFKRLDPQDVVVSAESITAPCWSNNRATLTTFYTSSLQTLGTSGDYYFAIYNTSSVLDSAEVQFTIGYADKQGSGSVLYNAGVPGKSPTSTVYGQYRSLILEDEEGQFTFGTGDNAVTSDYFYVLNLDRARFREKLLPGSFRLSLKTPGQELLLKDNSDIVSTTTFIGSNRAYELVSIVNGKVTGSVPNSGSYGKLLPDIGVILLNGLALDTTGSAFGLSLGTQRGSNVDNRNPDLLLNAIKSGSLFTLNNEETVSSNFVFVRARNNEFNYSVNPSLLTGSGELRFSNMIESPQSFVTTVGLYNDNNDLLAVAKLSRPLLKDFTKESLIRIKLDY